MTPSRWRSSSWTPQKQPPARIAVSVLVSLMTSIEAGSSRAAGAKVALRERHQRARGGGEAGVAPLDEGERLVQRRVERHGAEEAVVAEGVDQRPGDES